MMVNAGDVLEHPVTREKMVIRKTACDTNGELFQAELYLPPGGFVAAAHIHPRQEERFAIIAGTLRGRIGAKEVTQRAGEQFVVSAGTPHVWWNAGEDELQVLGEIRPALQTEHFFAAFFGLAQAGKVHPKTGLPNLLQMAVLLRAYRHELILAQPPALVQTLLFGGLAPIGRALGYKAAYPYPQAAA